MTVKVDQECFDAWPGARSGDYDPRCCRWPKSCSASQDEVPDEDVPEREGNVVPLVTYRWSGVNHDRVQIGTAQVREDGSVVATIDDPLAREAMLNEDGFSFGLGRSAPERPDLVDVVAELRAENRQLRRALDDLIGQARTMRRDVAELARQAGVLLEGQAGS